MENQTTVKDILIDVSKLLNGINIPVAMVESIGIPVARAINGIKICIDAFDQQKEAEQEKQESALEIVECENTEGEDDA